MKNKKAFTLIELLVVISIIALLLSILMPALGMAKQQAMFVICKTRMKDFGLAMRLYANDNNDDIMGGGGTWTWRIIPYYDFEGNGTYGDQEAFLKDYKDPFTCPTAIKQHKPDRVSEGNRTFGVNAAVMNLYAWNPGDAPRDRKPYLDKIDEPISTAETMFFVCSAQYLGPVQNHPAGYWYYGGSTWLNMGYPPGFYHFGTEWVDISISQNGMDFAYIDGRENVLFFDNHIEGMKFEEWPCYLNPDAPRSIGMFWKGGVLE